MKELNFLKIIAEQLTENKFLGDDCAFLEELCIFVTQDTLVEDVHFSLSTTSAYLLGRKLVSVNLSDLAASMSVPKYITVSMSLPSTIQDEFVSELYRGINDVCKKFKVNVIGGDITSSEKVILSVCAIGKKNCKYVTSRSFAKKGDYIITTGFYGSSSCGLHSLLNFLYAEDDLIQSHLNPTPKINEAKKLAKILNVNIAGIDTSDGLIDALYKISEASKHSIQLDFDSVPVSETVKSYCNRNNLDYKDFVLWGGEDFELIFTVTESIYKKLDKSCFKLIGRVLNKSINPTVNIKSKDFNKKITKAIFEKKSYNHFEG